MSHEPKIRIITDDQSELTFTVEYAGIKYDVSAYGEDYPNPQLAGTTKIHWCAGFVGGREDLLGVASDLHWVAESIHAIGRLGAREWLDAPRKHGVASAR